MGKMVEAGSEYTEVDPHLYPDGVIRLRRRGEANDFLQILPDGTIKAGNGTAVPTQAGSAADARYLPVPADWVSAAALMTAEGTSWVNLGSGYQTARYRMIGTDVVLEGVIRGGATATVAFHLPVGSRPAMNQRFTVDASGGPAVIVITPDGQVSINDLASTTSAVNTFVNLTGIRFSTL